MPAQLVSQSVVTTVEAFVMDGPCGASSLLQGACAGIPDCVRQYVLRPVRSRLMAIVMMTPAADGCSYACVPPLLVLYVWAHTWAVQDDTKLPPILAEVAFLENCVRLASKHATSNELASASLLLSAAIEHRLLSTELSEPTLRARHHRLQSILCRLLGVPLADLYSQSWVLHWLHTNVS